MKRVTFQVGGIPNGREAGLRGHLVVCRISFAPNLGKCTQ